MKGVPKGVDETHQSFEFKFLISAWKGTKLSVQVQYTKHDETTKMPVELLLYILLMANFHQVVESFKVF